MDTIELSRKYGSHPVARAIVSCIPYVGGGLDIILTEKWNKYTQDRIERVLTSISESISTLEETKIDLDFLESPAFYDLLINAIPVALRIRSEEIQIAIADMIKEALIHPEKIDTIEGLVNDLSGFREKDLALFRTLSRLFDDRAMITPCNVYDDSPSMWMDLNEADRYMSRFANMLLLDYPRNVLSRVGQIAYRATPLFFQLKTSMGL